MFAPPGLTRKVANTASTPPVTIARVRPTVGSVTDEPPSVAVKPKSLLISVTIVLVVVEAIRTLTISAPPSKRATAVSPEIVPSSMKRTWNCGSTLNRSAGPGRIADSAVPAGVPSLCQS